MKRTFVASLALAAVAMGCANMKPTEQRALSGGAIGAASGALLGGLAGHAASGAAIGGATGALGGYLYEKDRERRYDR